ncbi:hypothetical protein TraAM80_09747 [Trypanosoma rangeli]|uniref:Uncharacterized protein n=1 Tax=Trypanosoma rangeli TaxID=5698 RepID=A0A3R7JTA8_TRYRA|nr:uncharacterized protein TraAM80_09747 [Trypanosoma rangeli]RNE96520.1 hypothetical protein TraAM80_09747 [Trypanosoma rangeli]|eukprot:RNE96520.1 hypothetical protein TraAM80_09747 [Trypanosoma rangeli]
MKRPRQRQRNNVRCDSFFLSLRRQCTACGSIVLKRGAANCNGTLRSCGFHRHDDGRRRRRLRLPSQAASRAAQSRGKQFPLGIHVHRATCWAQRIFTSRGRMRWRQFSFSRGAGGGWSASLHLSELRHKMPPRRGSQFHCEWVIFACDYAHTELWGSECQVQYEKKIEASSQLLCVSCNLHGLPREI